MTAPERIWLQDNGDFDAASDVTWCQHRIEDNDTEYVRVDLAAVPAQVMVKPWNYCPECGCEEPRYGEGPHKQCARCYQEWFTDIDYSGVVRGNLERLFIAAIRQPPDPRDTVIARLVEAADVTLHDIDDLVANSAGVAGLHMNGDVAEWETLLDGGAFGSWLASVEKLRAALAAAKAVLK